MDIRINKSTFKTLLVSLIIIALFSIYFFGLRILILLFINLIVSAFTEYIFFRKKKYSFNKEIVLTAFIFTLTLPPTFPFILSALGIFFGVFFGKCVYGGSGHNIFNPALVARLFLHASFTKQMTGIWTKPVIGPLGGYVKYIGETTDLVSSATPLLSFRWTGEETNMFKLASGFTGGSIGETSAVLIVLIGIFLLIKKIISKEIVFSILITYYLISLMASNFSSINILNPVHGLLSGGLLFASVFMATDPVTSPKYRQSKIIYGMTIGMLTFVLRTYSLYAGGIMFAILFANMLTPLFDMSVEFYNKSSNLKRSNENV